eukprot:403367951
MEAGGLNQQIQQSSLQDSSNQDFTTLKQLYEQKLTLLQEKLETESHERQQFAAQFQQSHGELERVKIDNLHLHKQIEVQKGELLTAKADVDMQVSRAHEISSVKQKIELERDSLYKRIEDMQDKFRIQIDEMKKNNHELWSEKSKFEIERDQLKARVDQLESKMIEVDREKDYLKNIHSNLLENITNMQIEFDAQCDETRKAQRDLDSLKNEHEFLKSSKDDMQKKGLQMITDYQQKIEQLEKEIQNLRLMTDKTNLERIQFTTSKTQLENELKITNERLTKAQNDYSKLQRDYDACMNLKNRLEGDKQRIMNELNEVKEKYKAISVARSQSEARQLIGDSEIQTYSQELKKMFDQQRTYPKEIEKLKSQLQQYDSQVIEYQDFIKQLKEAFITLKNEHQQVLKKLQSQTEANNYQDQAMQSLRNALQKRQMLYVDIETHYQSLSQAVESFGYHGEVMKKYDQLIKNNPKINQVKMDKAKEELINHDDMYQKFLQVKIELDMQTDKVNQKEEIIEKLQSEIEERQNEVEKLKQVQPKLNQQNKANDLVYLPSEQLNTIQNIYNQDINKKIEELKECREKISDLEQANFNLQAQYNLMKQSPLIDPKDYVSKEQCKKLEQDLEKKIQEAKQLTADIGIEKSKNNLLQMRINIETSQKTKLETQVKELKVELDQEKQQVENLKQNQLQEPAVAAQSGQDLIMQIQAQQDNSQVQTVSDDKQFQSLTEIIKKLREEKDYLHRQIRQKEVSEVHHDTITQNLNIIIENLRGQVKQEQDKNTELQKLIKFLQSNSSNTQDQSSMVINTESRQSRHETESSKTINELKELLLVQKDSYDSQIAERDRYIQELQDLIIENDRIKQVQQQELDSRIENISRDHYQELQQLNNRLQEIQTENAQILAQREDLQNQIDTYMNEREKLLITDEMKNSELQRLQILQNENDQRKNQSSGSGMDPALIRNYSERIDNIQASLSEKENEFRVKIQDLEVQVDSLKSERTLLNDEIDSLKERESLLKKEVQSLTQLLDKLKGTTQTVSTTGADNQMEQNILSLDQQEQIQRESFEQAGQLILRERLNKAENDVESLRSQLLAMNQKNKQYQSEINKMMVLAEKHALKVEEINLRSQQYQQQLKMLEEVNAQNQSLHDEIGQLRQQLEKARLVKPIQPQVIIEKQVDEEATRLIQEQVQYLTTSLLTQREKYEEMKSQLRQNQSGDAPGILASQIQDSSRLMIKSLFTSLHKSRQLVSTILQYINLNEIVNIPGQESQPISAGAVAGAMIQEQSAIEEIGGGNQLGKRQRTN